jgi:predicted Zn-dependent peptidase
MNLIINENKELNEKNYIYTHESGLKIIISPKKGFSKTCMMFGTSFGSVVNRYINENKEEIVLPDGIAHFLEHKLFESEEGDAFTKYAQTGGNANAYTSFNHTVYYFSCTDKFYDNADILLDLMQTPYFTKENVEKICRIKENGLLLHSL